MKLYWKSHSDGGVLCSLLFRKLIVSKHSANCCSALIHIGMVIAICNEANDALSWCKQTPRFFFSPSIRYSERSSTVANVCRLVCSFIVDIFIVVVVEEFQSKAFGMRAKALFFFLLKPKFMETAGRYLNWEWNENINNKRINCVISAILARCIN